MERIKHQRYVNNETTYAAQLEEANVDMEMLKRRIAAFEAQLEPKPDNVVVDIEELRKVVKCLTTEDKIVQITFDEVFTNNMYSRRTDTLIGCQYADDKQKETYPYKTMLVFGSLKENGEKLKDEYGYSIMTKLYKLEETTSKFWTLRGAIVNAGVPWHLSESMQFFNNSTTGILEAAIEEGVTPNIADIKI
ncbi:hypothetical protein GQX74_011715 [Glossina fuscipes]|nr:hypothetical protein GQX74_011715 [Glossina fuscipes]